MESSVVTNHASSNNRIFRPTSIGSRLPNCTPSVSMTWMCGLPTHGEAARQGMSFLSESSRLFFPASALFFCAKHTYTLRKQKLYGSSAPLATAVILAKTANLTVQVQKEQICAKWGHSPWSTECHTSSSSIVGITCWLLYDNTKGR